MITDKRELVFFSLVLIVFSGLGYVVGVLNTPTEYVHIPIYHNNTVERVEMQACNLSCLDARNEGYLDGVAECGMNKMYVTAVDGSVRSYVNNTEGFYSSEGVMCVQTTGRTSDQILGTVVHELIHREVYEFPEEHFCEVKR